MFLRQRSAGLRVDERVPVGTGAREGDLAPRENKDGGRNREINKLALDAVPNVAITGDDANCGSLALQLEP